MKVLRVLPGELEGFTAAKKPIIFQIPERLAEACWAARIWGFRDSIGRKTDESLVRQFDYYVKYGRVTIPNSYAVGGKLPNQIREDILAVIMYGGVPAVVSLENSHLNPGTLTEKDTLLEGTIDSMFVDNEHLHRAEVIFSYPTDMLEIFWCKGPQRVGSAVLRVSG